MSNRIHPTAVIGPQVQLGENNVIGPYCVFQGPIEVGDDNFFSPHCSVGGGAEVSGIGFPASWEDESEEGGVTIGSSNVVKEFVRVNTGWASRTRVGDGCMLMGTTYLAHDVQVGSGAILSSGVLVGGHAVIDDGANLGMGTAVHQRRFVGAGSMIGMQAAVSKDIPPFTVAMGVPARPTRLNTHRLDRMEVSRSDLDILSALVLGGAGESGRLPESLRRPVERWLALVR